MALLSTWSDENKVVNDLPIVTYESIPTYHVFTDGTSRPIFWTMTRRSSHSFAYIGMSKLAAADCASALRKEWTRKYMQWEAEISEGTAGIEPEVIVSKVDVLRCSAEIQPQHADGDNWEVSVNVEEVDTVISTTELTDADEIEKFFQDASSRHGALFAYRGEWLTFSGTQALQVFYTHEIAAFDVSKLKIYAMTSDNVWHLLRTVATGNGYMVAQRSVNATLARFVYDGEIVSNSVKLPKLGHQIGLRNINCTFDFFDTERPVPGEDESFAISVTAHLSNNPATFAPNNPKNWSVDLNETTHLGYTFTDVVKSPSGDGTYFIARAASASNGGRNPIRRTDIFDCQSLRLVYNDGRYWCQTEEQYRQPLLWLTAMRIVARSAESVGVVVHSGVNCRIIRVNVYTGFIGSEFSTWAKPSIGFDFNDELLVDDFTATEVRQLGGDVFEYKLDFYVPVSEIPEGVESANVCIRYTPRESSMMDVLWWSGNVVAILEAEE